MDLNAIMDDVAERLKVVTGLRTFSYPPLTVSPPAGIVSYPDSIDYDQTYGRGMTVVRGLPVIVVAGKATDRTAREKIVEYANDQGARSIKVAIEAEPYTVWDEIQVSDSNFDVVTIAGIDYIAVMFTVTIACQGNPAS